MGVDAESRFVFDDALAQPSPFLLRVEWPGIERFIGEQAAPDGRAVVEIPAVVMQRAARGEQRAEVRGRVGLEGAEDHGDIEVLNLCMSLSGAGHQMDTGVETLFGELMED